MAYTSHARGVLSVSPTQRGGHRGVFGGGSGGALLVGLCKPWSESGEGGKTPRFSHTDGGGTKKLARKTRPPHTSASQKF